MIIHNLTRAAYSPSGYHRFSRTELKPATLRWESQHYNHAANPTCSNNEVVKRLHFAGQFSFHTRPVPYLRFSIPQFFSFSARVKKRLTYSSLYSSIRRPAYARSTYPTTQYHLSSCNYYRHAYVQSVQSINACPPMHIQLNESERIDASGQLEMAYKVKKKNGQKRERMLRAAPLTECLSLKRRKKSYSWIISEEDTERER